MYLGMQLNIRMFVVILPMDVYLKIAKLLTFDLAKIENLSISV